MQKIIKLIVPMVAIVGSMVLAGCSGGEEDKGNVSDAGQPAAATKEGTAGQPSSADAGKESRAGDYK